MLLTLVSIDRRRRGQRAGYPSWPRSSHAAVIRLMQINAITTHEVETDSLSGFIRVARVTGDFNLDCDAPAFLFLISITCCLLVSPAAPPLLLLLLLLNPRLLALITPLGVCTLRAGDTPRQLPNLSSLSFYFFFRNTTRVLSAADFSIKIGCSRRGGGNITYCENRLEEKRGGKKTRGFSSGK